MERIALIADIHGNMPALDAVLGDIRGRGIRRVFCLGDLVGKGPESAAAVDLCREVCEQTTLGNWDAMLANEDSPPPPGPPDIVQILNWHRRQLGPDRLGYLRQLAPAIEFVMGGRNIRLFHASQRGIWYRVHFRDPVDKHLAMFDNTEFTGRGMTPDVVGYADIHSAFKTAYGDRILFNTGSVGNPLDKALASYVILAGGFGGERGAPFEVEIIRIPYDIELALRRARDAGMPEMDQWETELRTARYRGLPPLKAPG
jgi:protein phosphatase